MFSRNKNLGEKVTVSHTHSISPKSLNADGMKLKCDPEYLHPFGLPIFSYNLSNISEDWRIPSNNKKDKYTRQTKVSFKVVNNFVQLSKKINLVNINLYRHNWNKAVKKNGENCIQTIILKTSN